MSSLRLATGRVYPAKRLADVFVNVYVHMRLASLESFLAMSLVSKAVSQELCRSLRPVCDVDRQLKASVPKLCRLALPEQGGQLGLAQARNGANDKCLTVPLPSHPPPPSSPCGSHMYVVYTCECVCSQAYVIVGAAMLLWRALAHAYLGAVKANPERDHEAAIYVAVSTCPVGADTKATATRPAAITRPY